ncbi:MAG: copper amine oxidase N-terminal domain-containing protein [Bacillota bacterium]|nr:copper amine oxidase N-terminal domain-containing protein [Bacillota bacterium]
MKKWKKRLAGQLLAGLLSALPGAAFAAEEITVYVDGQQITFDQPPVVQDGRTLVPMRAIFEALGAEIEWHGAEKRVNAFWGINSFDLWIGSCEIQMGDGSLVTIDVPARISNGRTLVPLRAVSQCMGAEVLWDGGSRTVQIYRMPRDFYYQNDLYGYTFDTPTDFYFMEEYTDGSGAWYEHKTDPVTVSVMAGNLSGEEGKSIQALLQSYQRYVGDSMQFSMIRNDYSMEMRIEDGSRVECVSVHLHGGTETKVVVSVPSEMYPTYEGRLEEIHSCLAFG